MSGVPNVFGSATSSIPLSQLDVNFNTPVTIGNTTVGLGNTTITLVGLTNVSTTVVNTSNVSANTSLLLQTNGTTTAVTIDTNQNVGLGVTPSAWNTAYKVMQLGQGGAVYGHTSVPSTYLTSNSYQIVGSNTENYIANGFAAKYIVNANAGTHIWYNAPSGTAGNAVVYTQAMTLNASGNYFLGTTTNSINTSRASIFNDSSNNTATFAAQSGTAASTANMVCYHGAASGATAATQIAFLNGGGTQVGSITSTGSVTAFNPSSDKRLKDNIQSMTDGLNRVMKLKPVTFVWKENGEVDDGFIAQDLQETTEFKHRVNPIGERNGEMYYGVDYMRFVSVLTAAIQEQQAMITTLQSQVTALKAKVGV